MILWPLRHFVPALIECLDRIVRHFLAPDVDYTTISILVFGAPLSIALGVAILAGLLFVYASAWQRRV